MNNKGMALVTVLMLISIIIILIISLSTNSVTDFTIFKNFKDSKIDFYRDEASNKIEMSDIITIAVSDVSKESTIKNSSISLSDTDLSYSYQSVIKFLYYKNSVKPGTSLNMFSNYYYSVETTVNNEDIKTRVYKLGPKM